MIRLGSIEFINSLPVDLGLLSGAVPFSCRILQDTPAQLNRKILNDELDVSPVSAFFYAEHAEELFILPDLSVSSESGVMSVLLFSRFSLAELKDKTIFLTGKGRTTPVLLEILCRLRHGFIPETKPMTGPFGNEEGADALLLIGDEALLEKGRLTGLGFQAIDLAEEWRRWTGLPLVFAVWAVRRSVFAVHGEAIERAHEAILRSKNWGLAHLDLVKAAAAERSGLPEAVLTAYFSKLSYGWTSGLERGLLRYFQCAADCGFLKNVPRIEKLPLSGVQERKAAR
ncbi:MAG: menaquinone biosynthesis protein [Candidatus Omnitrophica bacterium]|nr:menaquinone biosynthesis protein [Candidatus Omnitrophota bacterium]